MEDDLLEMRELIALKIQILEELHRQIREELRKLYGLQAEEIRAEQLDPKTRKIREEFLKEYGERKYQRGRFEACLEGKLIWKLPSLQMEFEPAQDEPRYKTLLEEIIDLKKLSVSQARKILERLKAENEKIPF